MNQKVIIEARIDDQTNHIAPEARPWKLEILYVQTLALLYLHVSGAYGLYLYLTAAQSKTILFTIIIYLLTNTGFTTGAHRLWTHKSYKANIPLQVFLMICFCMGYQNSLQTWIHDHRMHHKYSDTDADPHNPTRGLFFSHIGWLLVRRHPEVRKHRKQIDMSDVYSNPVVMFQKRYSIWLLLTLTFIIPTLIPVYFWEEILSNAWHINNLRYIANLNVVLAINSVCHRWGYRPYDKAIPPSDNTAVHLMTLGDGCHNYHHVFPWDYRSAEFGNLGTNYAKYLIDVWARMGWAYDLRSASDDVIEARVKRTGDGSHNKVKLK